MSAFTARATFLGKRASDNIAHVICRIGWLHVAAFVCGTAAAVCTALVPLGWLSHTTSVFLTIGAVVFANFGRSLRGPGQS